MANAANFSDFFKAFGDFKAPAFDFGNLASLQRRNVEAFTAANQAWAEGVQAAAKRQSEVVREGIENFIRASKDILTSTSPENNTAKQIDYCRSVCENAMSSAREIAEMYSKSGMEAWNLLNKHAADSVHELSAAPRATRKSA